MDTTALVIAVLSLVSALWVGYADRKARRRSDEQRSAQEKRLIQLEYELREREKHEERQFAAKERLDRHREPLILAADDLRDRLDNIRRRGFAQAYLRSPDKNRQRIALLGTVYRMGKYWAVVEKVYRDVGAHRFESEPGTAPVAELLTAVGRAFASDSAARGGTFLMVWREEQRAIGELMSGPGESDAIGFAEFADRHDSLTQWLSGLESDLLAKGLEASPRLAELEDALARLVVSLEAGRQTVSQSPRVV